MKRILVYGIGWLVSAAAFAQPTLDECRRMAREHYPEIRQYDVVALTEGYDLSNAARAWIPQVSLSAQATWQNATAKFPDALTAIWQQYGLSMQGVAKTQYNVGIEVSQNIWDGGKSRADHRIAKADADEQRRAADVELYAVEGRVDDLYFGILLLDGRQACIRLTCDLLRSNLEKMRSLVRNGVAMASDADALEAELLTVGQQLTQTEMARASYRQMLELFIGEPLGEGDLPLPEAAEPLAHDSERPELAMFAARSSGLSARERTIKSAAMPQFKLFATGSFGYPGYDLFKSMTSRDGQWNFMAGVRMSWNFGAFYTQKNNLEKLQAARQAVDIQRDIFLFNNELQLTRERGEIARLRRVIADDGRIVALRRSVREAAESKLRNGVIDTDELLQKITDETTAAISRTTHEIELLKTICELKHTINR